MPPRFSFLPGGGFVPLRGRKTLLETYNCFAGGLRSALPPGDAIPSASRNATPRYGPRNPREKGEPRMANQEMGHEDAAPKRYRFIFRAYITRNGKRIYARSRGLKAFRIKVRIKD